MSTGKDPTLGSLALIGIGFIVYRYGLGLYRLSKTIQYTPTAKAVAVAPGIAEVYGKATLYKKRYTAPFSKLECLFYQTDIYKWEGSGRSRKKSLVKSICSQDPILITDDTGTVLVQPETSPSSFSSSIGLVRDRFKKDRFTAGVIGSLLGKEADRNSELYKFIKKVSPKLLKYSDYLEVHETYISDGDKLYVLGTAEVFDDTSETPLMLIQGSSKNNPFCIADGNEASALFKVNLKTFFALIGGPAISFGGYHLILYHHHIADGLPLNMGVVVLVSMYLFILIILFLEMYNGLVKLKINIERAKANTDALLKLRLDLIPRIVEIVNAYVTHEKRTIEETVNLKANVVGSSNKTLFAITEQYPELKADKNYGKLYNQIVTIEDRIAASRLFVNDSVELYNRQRGSFPYVLFSKRVGFEPIAFMNFG